MISVIIPLYNAEKTIDACVYSVLRQSVQPKEILLVDDGSTDGTAEAAEKWCRRDGNIRLFREAHAGTSKTRNRGLMEAEGEWVLFLDADDQLAENALAEFSAYLDDTVDACCGRILRGTEKKKNCKKSAARLYDPSELLDRALAEPTDLLTIHGWIFRRSVCIEQKVFFHDRLRLGEDSDWVLRYLAVCKGAALIPEWVYRYSISPESTINHWKPGQTEAYLDMLDVIGNTPVGQKKNWPLFVLTVLLLILTHDTFHPANPADREERYQEIRRLRTLPVMEAAFRHAELSELGIAKRITLMWLKVKCYPLARAAVWLRQRQNAKRINRQE